MQGISISIFNIKAPGRFTPKNKTYVPIQEVTGWAREVAGRFIGQKILSLVPGNKSRIAQPVT